MENPCWSVLGLTSKQPFQNAPCGNRKCTNNQKQGKQKARSSHYMIQNWTRTARKCDGQMIWWSQVFKWSLLPICNKYPLRGKLESNFENVLLLLFPRTVNNDSILHFHSKHFPHSFWWTECSVTLIIIRHICPGLQPASVSPQIRADTEQWTP